MGGLYFTTMSTRVAGKETQRTITNTMPIFYSALGNNENNQNGDGLRRSGAGVLNRARARTLKMTFVIVLVFVLCWTPYYIISLW